MSLQVGSFTASGSGTTINYSVSWVDFLECSNSSTRTVSIRLFDLNRNAVVDISNNNSVSADGTITGNFTNVYKGLFTVLALFICSDVGSVITIAQSPEVDLTESSTVDPVDPGDPSEPTPVDDDPDNNPGICIPTTGAVSMGDLNVIFGRARDLSNTELSGSSNPSVAPSLFGVSFLPNNVVSPGKLRPNAISEFRGYCHVPPIEAITVSYECESPGSEPGRIIIDYFNLSGTAQQVNRTVSGGGFVIGTFDVKPGTNVTVTVENDAVSPTGAEITILRDATLLVNQTGNPSALIKFVVNNISTYSILGTIGTGGGGGGPI